MMYASKSRNGIHQLQLHGYNIYIYIYAAPSVEMGNISKAFSYKIILLTLLKSILFVILLYFVQSKSLWLTFRHKENLKDKTRR